MAIGAHDTSEERGLIRGRLDGLFETVVESLDASERTPSLLRQRA